MNPPKEIQSWHTLWMSMCYLVSMKSKDPSTKVGCVIIGEENNLLSIGYNGPPRGMNDRNPQNFMRPHKYLIFEHGERNAIYNAGRNGTPLLGSTLYITWVPCSDCARGVIQTGVKSVIIHKQGMTAYRMSREGEDIHSWEESCDMALSMFDECGVEYHWYDGPIIHRTFATFSGKSYQYCGPEYSPMQCGAECPGRDCDQHVCWECVRDYDDN